MTDEAERLREDLRRIAAAISHDLQEPARTVMGFLDMLTEDHAAELPPAALDFVSSARAGGERMQRMLTALLDYVRAGDTLEQRDGLDISSMVLAARSDLADLFAERGAELQCPRLGVMRCDENLMVDVFVELLANALKYSRPGVPPRIAVAGGQLEDGGVWLTVQDNGIGFEARQQERIFDLFQRLHGREAYSGIGAGLARVRRIIEAHGGRLSARGRPGEGATFRLELPRG